MPRKSSILRKGLAVIAIPILFQLLFAAFLLVRQQRLDEAGQWAIHTKEVIAQAETMFRTIIEADSSVRAYVTTGDREFDSATVEAFGRLPGQFAALIHQVRDNPPQVARLKVMHGEIDRLVDERENLRRSVPEDRSKTAAQLQEVLRVGRVRVLRSQLDEFLGVEEALDRRRIKTLALFQTEQVWILLAGAVALLAVGAASSLIFTRGIVRRLSTLNDNVHRLSIGESLVPPVAGHDEISALDSSFHQMASDLAAAAEKEKRHQESLERRTTELTATNRELSQKSDENEMFVYSVSHDLRSPLVNLQGFGKELGLAMTELKEVLTASDVPPATRTEVQQILEHGMTEPIRFIQTAVTRLSAIIDALLRLSRAGRVEYQRMAVDVQSILARVTDAMQSTASQKKARIEVAPGLPGVWADPTAVEQIFANLVGNALNYLDAKRPGVIKVSAVPDASAAGFVTFQVQDNGLGIPDAYLAKIFSIFQRVHGNIAPGEGIGLALVRRMVERHGGRIWVESEDGVGSSFFVSLPSEPPAENAENAPA